MANVQIFLFLYAVLEEKSIKMKIVAIISVILNIGFAEISAYERGLYSERVIIPAKANETVQYQIIHPITVS